MGDSVGRWEGDTLVVDTTNFTDKTRFRGSSQNLHVVERFTRARRQRRCSTGSRSRIRRPGRVRGPASIRGAATDAPIYEYACHEGNYALEDIMRGARYLEKEGQQALPPPAAAAIGRTGRRAGGRDGDWTTSRERVLRPL